MSAKIANPVLKGFNPDPSICRVGDTYYIATSTFEWFPGVQIYASKDLQTWELVARPLDRPDLLDMRGVPDSCGVWAPCLSHADGRFWLLYTNVRRFDGDFKDTPNYLTTCETIGGDWAPPIYLNASGFDPSLFHDDDGRKWVVNMLWDHRRDRTYFRGIILQEYSHAEGGLTGPRREIFAGTETGLTEGPHLYKIHGSYYLMVAEGGTGYEHAVSIVKAEEIGGPYCQGSERHIITAVDKPDKPLQRTGHASLVQTSDGRWFMPFLATRPLPGTRVSPMGRETAITEVYFDQDGWLRLSDPEGALEAAAQEPEAAIQYAFAPGQLHADFQWLRTPYPDDIFSTTACPGRLRLFGRESPGSLFSQALVARRQTSHHYRAATVVDFAPTDSQQMAGLIAYYNQHKFHYLSITADDEGRRRLEILSCAGDQSLHLDQPLRGDEGRLPAEGPLNLAVRVDGAKLQFEWSAEGVPWRVVGPELDASALSDEAGKGDGANFTGTFVGMACHDLTGQGLAADFAEFSYQNI